MICSSNVRLSLNLRQHHIQPHKRRSQQQTIESVKESAVAWQYLSAIFNACHTFQFAFQLSVVELVRLRTSIFTSTATGGALARLASEDRLTAVFFLRYSKSLLSEKKPFKKFGEYIVLPLSNFRA